MDRRQPFTLTFTGPVHLTLNQGSQPFDHHSMGLLEIFLAPVAVDETSVTYVAVFN